MSSVPNDPSLGRRWCPPCGRMVPVEDRFIEDTGDSRLMVEEYVVTVLTCGHTLEETTRTYRSPLRQAGPTRAMSAPDPFRMEGE